MSAVVSIVCTRSSSAHIRQGNPVFTGLTPQIVIAAGIPNFHVAAHNPFMHEAQLLHDARWRIVSARGWRYDTLEGKFGKRVVDEQTDRCRSYAFARPVRMHPAADLASPVVPVEPRIALASELVVDDDNGVDTITSPHTLTSFEAFSCPGAASMALCPGEVGVIPERFDASLIRHSHPSPVIRVTQAWRAQYHG